MERFDRRVGASGLVLAIATLPAAGPRSRPTSKACERRQRLTARQRAATKGARATRTLGQARGDRARRGTPRTRKRRCGSPHARRHGHAGKWPRWRNGHARRTAGRRTARRGHGPAGHSPAGARSMRSLLHAAQSSRCRPVRASQRLRPATVDFVARSAASDIHLGAGGDEGESSSTSLPVHAVSWASWSIVAVDPGRRPSRVGPCCCSPFGSAAHGRGEVLEVGSIIR